MSSSPVQAGELGADIFGGIGGQGSSIPGPLVADLVNDSRFPEDPVFSTATGDIPPVEIGIQWPEPFEETGDFGDNYGLRMQGYLQVPADGQWKFFVRSDDGSSFRLNQDGADPAGAEEVARVPGEECCDGFLDDGIRSSDPIELEKGKEYYFEFLLKENTGAEWGQVGWTGPEIDTPQVITERFVQRFVSEAGAPVITKQPQDQEVDEGDQVVFQVAVDAPAPVDYQWNKDGEPIEGAQNAFLELENASPQEHGGASFSVEISNASTDQPITSEPATLTVNPDTTAPRLISARGSGRQDGIVVQYSEAIDEGSATDVANYTITGQDVTISEATLLEEDRVLLDVSEYTGDPIRLQVSDVTDRSVKGNTIASDSEVPVALALTLRGYWPFNAGESEVALDPAGGHPGRFNGDPEWVSDAAPVDQRENPFALSFDGDGDFVQTDFSGIGGAQARTVSAWIRPDNIAEPAGIVFWGGSFTAQDPGEKYAFRINDATSTLRTEVSAGNNWASTQLTEGEWHHVVSVVPNIENPNNDDVIHYLNGQLDPRAGGQSQPINTDIEGDDSVPVTIGAQSPEERDMFFTGEVDDVAIFNQELTEEQIVALSNGEDPLNIAESLTGPLTIAQQPQGQTVTELRPARFSVNVTGSEPSAIEYQWFRNGEPVQGATKATWTLEEPIASENDGDEITVEAFNTDGTFSRVTSEAVTLTVEKDTSPPQVTDVKGFGGGVNRFTIRFDEQVAESTATNLANYSSEGLTLEGATLSENGREVTITTSQQTFDQQYNVTVDGVSDVAPTPNVLSTDVTFTSVLSYSEEVLVDNPVRYWRLAETSGTTAASVVSGDDDPATANGTYAGEPTLGAESLILTDADNPAVNFGGGQNVDIPNGGEINVGGPYQQKTIEMWIQPDQILGSEQAQGLWEQGGATRGIGLYLIGNEVFMNAWNNADDGEGTPWGSGTEGQDPVFVGGGNIQAGQPAHVVGVMNGVASNDLSGTLKLYVNGELVDETEGVGQLFDHGGDVDIAEVADLTHTEVGTGNLNGTIDELALYNTALSPERIQGHFEAAFKGVLSGPAAITKEPQDKAVAENGTAEFNVEMDGVPPYEVTWFKNGQQVKQVSTVENSSSLSFKAIAEENDTTVSVDVSNSEGEVSSRQATLTVEMDTRAPQVAEITAAAGESGIIIIVFDEPVEEASATDISNYSIEGVTVTEARLRPDGRTVVLTTEAQEVDQSITVGIDGIKDLAAAANESATESTVQAADLKRPVQAYWDFEEDGSDIVDRVNGHDGTLQGDAQRTDDTPSLTGRESSSAVEFDGDGDFVETPYAGIGGNNPRTVSFWVKTTDTSTHGIVAWGDDSTAGEKYHIRVNGGTGTVRTEVQGGNNWGSTEIVDGEWHHVASVVPNREEADNLDVIHYVDGELDPRLGGASQLINTDISSDDAVALTIGRRTQGEAQDYFTGTVDDVAIFDAALTAGQIAELASGQSPLNIVQQPEAPEAPELSISLEGSEIRIEFDGKATLQTAPSVTGPWGDSDQQESPATFPVNETQTRFFRVVR